MPVEPCALIPLGTCAFPCSTNPDRCCGDILGGGESKTCFFDGGGEATAAALTPEGKLLLTLARQIRQLTADVIELNKITGRVAT